VHTVVLTHAHLDHAGLASRWQEEGARVVAGRADAPALMHDGDARERERRLGRAELLRQGVPPEALAVPASVSERYTRWRAPLRMSSVQPDGLLDDGDAIAPGGRPLRVLACPGHTPGTIVVIDDVSGAYFTGDHVLPRMAPSSGIQFEGERRRPSLPAYLASLHRARALGNTCRCAYPGHGALMPDLAEEATWAVRLLEQRARRLLAQLQHGPGTAYTLALRMFPHLGARHLRPVMAETIGLLDLLAERGQARADESPSEVVWHPLV
jgi:glyoxylase-like metal-dependent hydrolase (beta-lactamase superfamily II)